MGKQFIEKILQIQEEGNQKHKDGGKQSIKQLLQSPTGVSNFKNYLKGDLQISDLPSGIPDSDIITIPTAIDLRVRRAMDYISQNQEEITAILKLPDVFNFLTQFAVENMSYVKPSEEAHAKNDFLNTISASAASEQQTRTTRLFPGLFFLEKLNELFDPQDTLDVTHAIKYLSEQSEPPITPTGSVSSQPELFSRVASSDKANIIPISSLPVHNILGNQGRSVHGLIRELKAKEAKLIKPSSHGNHTPYGDFGSEPASAASVFGNNTPSVKEDGASSQQIKVTTFTTETLQVPRRPKPSGDSDIVDGDYLLGLHSGSNSQVGSSRNDHASQTGAQASSAATIPQFVQTLFRKPRNFSQDSLTFSQDSEGQRPTTNTQATTSPAATQQHQRDNDDEEIRALNLGSTISTINQADNAQSSPPQANVAQTSSASNDTPPVVARISSSAARASSSVGLRNNTESPDNTVKKASATRPSIEAIKNASHTTSV